MPAEARAPSRITLGLLVLLGLINLVRGAIHVFLPDSGAGVIAHFELAEGGRTIVFLLAMVGAGQIGSGLIDLLVVARFRAFAAPLLAIELLRALIALYIAFVSKSVGTGYPGARGIVGAAVVLTLAVLWEFGRRGRRG
ncbi:MAG TPA: hypothetical protein PLO65_00360 [Caulobacter sp.]|nr:hypothetical protein [Caulobacter sp.]